MTPQEYNVWLAKGILYYSIAQFCGFMLTYYLMRREICNDAISDLWDWCKDKFKKNRRGSN